MPFQKGKSGNPVGRPKGAVSKATADIKALAQKHTSAAIKELVRLSTKAENEGTRVAAIKELLDRGYGKPPQTSDVNVSGNISFVEAIAAAARLDGGSESDSDVETPASQVRH